MKEIEKKTFWLLIMVIAILGAAVIAQGIAMSGLHKKVDALSCGEPTVAQVAEEKEDAPALPSISPPTNSILSDPIWGFGDDWDPFKEMYSMRERIDQMFGNAFNRFGYSDNFSSLLKDYSFSPDINIEDKGKHFLVTVNLPGSDSSQVDVKVEGQTLTVSGEVSSKTKKEEDGKMLMQERRSGKFRRVVTLPSPVKADKMTTEEKKGVLYITLPKED